MKKRIFYAVKTVVIAFFLFVVTQASYENIDIKIELKEFMSRGVYDESESTATVKYYKVENNVDEESYTYYEGYSYAGAPGDIIVGLRSPFPNYPIVDPLVTFLFGGHAAFCCYPYDDYANTIDYSECLETLGMNGDYSLDCVSTEIRDYWDDADYRDNYIGLKVKATEEQKKEAFNYVVSSLGDHYNYTFIFNQKDTYYCTDLISRSYEKVGINLNHDLLGSTVHDLIVSSNTYISIYNYIDKNGIRHIYYLD